jgi:hypothetical protein
MSFLTKRGEGNRTPVTSLEGCCGCCYFNVHSDKWTSICPFGRKREYSIVGTTIPPQRRGCRVIGKATSYRGILKLAARSDRRPQAVSASSPC